MTSDLLVSVLKHGQETYVVMYDEPHTAEALRTVGCRLSSKIIEEMRHQ